MPLKAIVVTLLKKKNAFELKDSPSTEQNFP